MANPNECSDMLWNGSEWCALFVQLLPFYESVRYTLLLTMYSGLLDVTR